MSIGVYLVSFLFIAKLIGWSAELPVSRRVQIAVRLTADDADAHYTLSVALAHKNDWDWAIREYRAAIRLKPDYPEAHYNLAVALEHKGDLQGALIEYRAASTLDPRNADFKKVYEGLQKK